MGRKAKISYDIKIKFVKEYLKKYISESYSQKKLGLHINTFNNGYMNIKL